MTFFKEEVFEEQAGKDIKETEKPPMISKLGKEFGMSLILSNVPKSPKFINGSFAAMFDNNQVSIRRVAHKTFASGLKRTVNKF